MRHPLVTLLLVLICASSTAQNVQLHYDFRKGIDPNKEHQSYLSATTEWLLPTPIGDNYFFVDLLFTAERTQVGGAYLEISQKIRFSEKCKFQGIVEFDGGLGTIPVGYVIANAYMAGINYNTLLKDWYLEGSFFYRYTSFKKGSHDAQFTVVWDKRFCKDRLSFCGYADLWSENKDPLTGGGKAIRFNSEPQLWYNIIPSVSVGVEGRIYANMSGYDFSVYPALGAKYTFK